MPTLVELDKIFLIENEPIHYANMKRNSEFCYLNHIMSIFEAFIHKLKCKWKKKKYQSNKMSALHMVHGTNNVILSNIGEIRNWFLL
jgi:hypothetical protein